MNRRVLFGAISAVIAVGGIVTLACVMSMQRTNSPLAGSSTSAVARAGESSFVAPSQPVPIQAPHGSKTLTMRPNNRSLRKRLHQAGDYARFVAEIRPLAEKGDPEAAYVLSKSLRWCSETSRLYFLRPNGEVRTLQEAQATFSYRTVGISNEVMASWYARCQGFLTSADSRKQLSTWSEWLDKAVDEGSPAAIAANASNVQGRLIVEMHSPDAHPTQDPNTANQARDAALSAVESGDPDAAFMMSDWIDASKRTATEFSTLVSAWQIVACQNGYDCGSDSDWMVSVCAYDAQCTKGRTYVGYLQQSLGSQYDDALRLAASIQSAILAKDSQALRSFL